MSARTPGSPLDLGADLAGVEPGTMLGDRYMVLDVRQGGMGEVFIVRSVDADDDSLLALKSFQKHLFFVRESRHAFVREVAIWMRLTGELHIMPALGLEYLDGRPFVSMPVVSTTVRDVLRRSPLPGEDAVAVAFQTALGMKAAQQRLAGVTHGDLKPENLLLAGGGVLVSDFGLARAAGMGQPSSALETTWAYRAPECWSAGGFSPAADVYAYGIMLYELLTGRRPFDADNRADWGSAHREAPPPRLEYDVTRPEAVVAEVAQRCVAKDPVDRPASFGEIFGELNERLVEVDAVLAVMLLHGSSELKAELAGVGEARRDQVAPDLIRIGEYDLALEELDSRPQAERTVRWSIAHGDALSLLERDAEALVSLEEAAAAPNATDEERWAALRSLGLSLKRLDRFDEAIAVFEQVRREVPDGELPSVLVNLATVYLDHGDWQNVVELLQPIAAGHPDLAELWANLGLAYEKIGLPADAVRALQQALRAAPHIAELDVHLARVLMEEYGAIGDAAVALDLAFQQGFDSREWYVRTRACAILLGDDQYAAELAVAIRDAMEHDLVDAMDAEAAEMVARLRSRMT